MAARGSNLFPAVFLAFIRRAAAARSKSEHAARRSRKAHYIRKMRLLDSKSGAARVADFFCCQKVFSIKNCTQRTG
jgi:hypothetical protein